jgi:CHAT domain-containing protein/Tfp pilus assembly protein PilF
VAVAGCTGPPTALSSSKTTTDQAKELIRSAQYAEAEPLLLRVLAERQSAFGPDSLNLSYTLHTLGLLYRQEGRYAEAEPLQRRALVIQERSLGTEDRVIATTLMELGYVLLLQGRYVDAEPLYHRALAIQERTLDQNDPAFAMSLDNIGYLYRVQGRYAEARSFYERALGIREKGLGPEHPEVARTLTNLGVVHRLQGYFSQAELLEQRALAIREKALGPEHPDVADSLSDLGDLYRAERQFRDGESVLKRAYTIEEKTLGPDHPWLATKGLTSLTQLYRDEGNINSALSASDRATSILERHLIRGVSQRSMATVTERRLYRDVFLDNIALTYAAARNSGQDAVEHSFIVAQYATASTAEQAVASMAARFATGDGALASSIRRLQDLADQWQQLDSALLKVASEPTSARDAGKEASLRASLEATDHELTNSTDRIKREFPEYSDIVSPQAIPISTVQALLGPDEVMLVYLIGKDRSWLWAVRGDMARLYDLGISAQELAEEVSSLRERLEPEDNPSLQPFPARRAYSLYRRILAPAAPFLQDKHNVLVVPDGALQSLPFGVLVTEAPRTDPVSVVDHRNVHWFARDHAVTVIPSVGSLHVLRAFTQPSRALLPFAGVGDPSFSGPADGAQATARGTVQDLGPAIAVRLPYQRLRSLRDGAAIVDAVRALPPLPETAVELRAIAQILGASDDNLLLGQRASERALRSAHLERYRIVEFATHGLMPGDLDLVEPALVLTPPDLAAGDNNGLLTASKVATLKFDADWIVLSACNTAASARTIYSDGFSSLAKAFFYAGARSVLISQWSVQSIAAVKITTGAFAELAKEPSIGRAEALRRSMMAMLDPSNPPAFSHPLAWAPFTLTGEGGEKWRK